MRAGTLCLLMLMAWSVTANTLKSKKPSRRQASEECDTGSFDCGDDECIQANWICDTVEDCKDHSDEKQNCPTDCTGPNQFKCDNGECMPVDFVCDGDDDCGDNSDEERPCGR